MMGTPWRSGLAVVLYAVAVVGMVAGLVSSWMPGGHNAGDESIFDLLPVYAVFLTYATVGVLILVRQPDNTVGSLVGAVGFFPMLGGGIFGPVPPARNGLAVARCRRLGRRAWYFFPAITTIPLLFLLFPDGRPASPRWRWPVHVAVALALGFAILRYMVGPGDCGSADCGSRTTRSSPRRWRPSSALWMSWGQSDCWWARWRGSPRWSGAFTAPEGWNVNRSNGSRRRPSLACCCWV